MFKVGDMVRLKSGSPKLTVTETFNGENKDGAVPQKVRCEWFQEMSGDTGEYVGLPNWAIFPSDACVGVSNEAKA